MTSTKRNTNISVAFVLVVFFFVGCGLTGFHQIVDTKEYEDGELVRATRRMTKAQFPEHAREGSSITTDSDRTQLAVGATYPPPKATTATETITAKGGMVLAGLFAVAAIGLVVARVWFPFIPLIAPMACAGASMVFFFMPTLVDKYGGYILLGLAGVALWAGYEGWHQRKLQKQDPNPIPKEDGDVID